MKIFEAIQSFLFFKKYQGSSKIDYPIWTLEEIREYRTDPEDRLIQPILQNIFVPQPTDTETDYKYFQGRSLHLMCFSEERRG